MGWPKGKPTEHLRHWTKEQEEYVRSHYNGDGSSLAEVLPFTASAIRNKAKRLGIKNESHFHNVVKTTLPPISEIDLSYIAGMLDGEGSIYPFQTGFRIGIANSDEAVIRWMHGVIGIGKVRISKAREHQHLDSYCLDISRHGDIWGFLEVVMPYLRIKKQKAINAINHYEAKHNKNVMISGG